MSDRDGHAKDERDPFGRAKIGVKLSDDLRCQSAPERGPWKLPAVIEEALHSAEGWRSELQSCEEELDRYRRLLRRELKDHGEQRTRLRPEETAGVVEAIEQAEIQKDDAQQEIIALEDSAARALWQVLYPDAPTLAEYEERERYELRAGTEPLHFDHREHLLAYLWSELVGYMTDEGFGENAEILTAIEERLGIGGFAQFVVALREADLESAARFAALVTEQEKRAARSLRFGTFTQLRAGRRFDGGLMLVADQPGNARYKPTWTGRRRTATPLRRPRRARQRQSRPSSSRRTGSRRIISRSAGGGSSGDDDPGGETEPPARGIRLDGPIGEIYLVAWRGGHGHPSPSKLLTPGNPAELRQNKGGQLHPLSSAQFTHVRPVLPLHPRLEVFEANVVRPDAEGRSPTTFPVTSTHDRREVVVGDDRYRNTP